MWRYVQVVVGVYDFSLEIQVRDSKLATARQWFSTTDLSFIMWSLVFHHVLSAETKFRYASKSKFLSSGLVITIRENISIWGFAQFRAVGPVGLAKETYHRHLPSWTVLACSSLQIRTWPSVLTTLYAYIRVLHAPLSRVHSVFFGGRNRRRRRTTVQSIVRPMVGQ
jgi:hypothetical protein